MKNRREQLKSLNTALQNIRKDKDEDRKKRKEINPTYDGRHHHGTFKKVEDVQEDLPANAVGQGGVDMNPTGGPARLKKSPMRRFEPAFDKRHKNKKLLFNNNTIIE